ncbi:3-oxoacyl-ACP reductase family protein [Pajaroellobacter abortibovis]|uniref:Beta-ketoacyl-ACP reductase n=1 Tax=Pajaroellobacter abortibovis TaxID=1882918 RepID=A0A1L6MXZ3_9BACT|nr:3-oxoacyl-ACP reductase family protein [Pajaroellobacter abortibovis]APS00268.1 beta-ketoacyl-ACP reductase [Pajaroellobacter abortibovis]
MFELKGKVALVTGGSRGIGRACVQAMAKQGAKVIFNYVKSQEAAEQLVSQLTQKGLQVDAVQFDVSHPEETEQAIDALIKKDGKLDILVANAGIAIDGLLLRLTEQVLNQMFDINVKGALLCAKAAAKHMIRNHFGRLIFLSSVIGETGGVGQVGYAASKAALIGGAKSIARELGSRQVTANIITPGFIETDMTSTISQARKEQLLQSIPLNRIGTGDDIAAAVVYLASEEAGYVTGQILRINGGIYI